MKRYVCIHGHFYQPPRENPWIGSVPVEESAAPYHDWNERIVAECYAPNASARILDESGFIREILNNYSRISFNFGPTLLSYLELRAPAVYAAITHADRSSRERFDGHGSALAQAYNHPILPLANRRDKTTQVVWGIRDFEHRFGRRPAGLWLPETAVDLETLDVLAEQGIAFTILAPGQARRVRLDGTTAWTDVGSGELDSTRAYTQRLPSGRTIALFFYDGETSQAIAFGRLLDRGDRLAGRLRRRFAPDDGTARLVHVATDGETFGHHHRFGDMALAWVLEHFDGDETTELINYGAFLARHPPRDDVEIRELSSWSCAHGVERWRSDCGCHTGAHPEWSQAWRAPLRAALDWLRDEADARFERRATRLLTDPWAARDDYVNVLLDSGPESRQQFLDQHAVQSLDHDSRVQVWELLELERQLQLMYTSCGWFHDDLGGIETVQVMRYAARAVELARRALDAELESGFLERLDEARSNRAELGSGADIYRDRVHPEAVDLEGIAAHAAAVSPFGKTGGPDPLPAHEVSTLSQSELRQGRARLVTGRLKVTARATEDSLEVDFGVLHRGDHDLSGRIRKTVAGDPSPVASPALIRAFEAADLPAVVRGLEASLGGRAISLGSVVGDELRRVLDTLLGSTLRDAAVVYRQLHDRHAPLIRYLTELHVPLPDALCAAGRFVVNDSLRRAIDEHPFEAGTVRELIRQSRDEGIGLDVARIELALEQAIGRELDGLESDPREAARWSRLAAAVEIARRPPLGCHLWQAENRVFRLVRSPAIAAAPQHVVEKVEAVARMLRVRLAHS